MRNKLRKAVITAGGRGTRFLPITKVVPKEMLPIGEQPTLHYLLVEAKLSGIEEVCIVLRERGSLTEKYFEKDHDLEAHLEEKGKKDLLDKVVDPSLGMKVTFIEQDKAVPIGHGAPVLSAAEWIGQDDFALLFCDDLVQAAVPALAQLATTWNETPELVGLVQTYPLAPEEILNTFSSVKYKENSLRRTETETGVYEFSQLEAYIEKPKSLDQLYAPELFIGRAIYSSRIIEQLRQNLESRRAFDGEFSLWDAMVDLAQSELVMGQRLHGRWLTTGSREQMREAARVLLGEDD